MKIERIVISKGSEMRKKKGVMLEQVVYITTFSNGKKTSRTAHEAVK